MAAEWVLKACAAVVDMANHYRKTGSDTGVYKWSQANERGTFDFDNYEG